MSAAAEMLIGARKTLRPIAELPGLLRPNSLAEAYALQDELMGGLGAPGGWKVGAPDPASVPRAATPMLQAGVQASPANVSKDKCRLRGVEAEIAFLLGKDLPQRATPYRREEVIAAIDSAHPAIELLESSFSESDAIDRLSLLGDLQMYGGFVHGPPCMNNEVDWRTYDYTKETVTISINGGIVVERGANPAGGDLLRLVAWLANDASARTGGLRAGQWITTGSWMGRVFAPASSRVEVCFSSFGSVTVNFE